VAIYRSAKLILFEKTTNTNTPTKTEANLEVTVRLIQKDDLPVMAKTFDGIERIFLERTSLGHLCFGALVNHEIVNLTWVALEGTYTSEIERNNHIASGAAYLYDVFTLPSFRGRGISSAVAAKVTQHLSNMQISVVYAGALSDNLASLHAKEKAGFRKLGYISYKRLLVIRNYKILGESEDDLKTLMRLYPKQRKLLTFETRASA
jgi:GNAT superfamily N-acetyltransferase